MWPTVQYDGITLIRQNVGIKCETDHPEYVHAQGQVSDVEGYFCSLRYNKVGKTVSMPRYVKVTATVFSQPEGASKPSYSL